MLLTLPYRNTAKVQSYFQIHIRTCLILKLVNRSYGQSGAFHHRIKEACFIIQIQI
ncbi:hypothetical protein AB4Y90_08155 [Chryseobacterium sp. 2TAF14]|uniref:hypothetical protein n=1 Tax=Chryseobacterium sp. 2TAF14 TaxID=3233007 RepID=UPI003F90D7BB